MPHKRAKPAIREQRRGAKGSDLVPRRENISDEAVPKSVARVLNAAEVRDRWRTQKRIREKNLVEDTAARDTKRRKVGKGDQDHGAPDADGKKVALVIQPGETLRHFNKRVDSDLGPAVNSAIHASSAAKRKLRKKLLGVEGRAKIPETTQQKDNKTISLKEKQEGRPMEFPTTSSSLPRRLNDVVGAPPVFNRLPRKATLRTRSGKGASSGVLSMAQKAMMDSERQRAILRYREMRATHLATVEPT